MSQDDPPATKKPNLKPGQHRPIYIDRNGTLRLLVGPGAVHMQVDANALRRASKVFDRMLFGPFIESHQTVNGTVELPEDDPEALRVIFHAVHANFGNMPRDLTISKFYDITVMADKYAMIGKLQLWGTIWTKDEKDLPVCELVDKEETSYDDLQRLVVLYHFSSCDQFSTALTNMAFNSRINQHGQLLFTRTADVDGVVSGSEHSEWNEVGLLPETIIGELSIMSLGASRRMVYIDSMPPQNLHEMEDSI